MWQGRGADLFESISAEIISAMILGGQFATSAGIKEPAGFVMFPLVSAQTIACVLNAESG